MREFLKGPEDRPLAFSFLCVPLSMSDVDSCQMGRVSKLYTRRSCLLPLDALAHPAPILTLPYTVFVDGLEGDLPFLTLGVPGPREPWPCRRPEPTSSKLCHPWCISVEIPRLSSSDPVWKGIHKDC